MFAPIDGAAEPSLAELKAELEHPGEPGTAGQLVQLFYPELRKMAAIRMAGERINHTWQPTILVNELYLHLSKMKALPVADLGEERQKAEFLALSAFLMKRLLIHYARPRQKRAKLRAEEVQGADTAPLSTLQEIEDLLNRLGAIDPTLRTVVEMKVFEGLSREEIGQRLQCSVRTVARHWEFAQNWLREKMGAVPAV